LKRADGNLQSAGDLSTFHRIYYIGGAACWKGYAEFKRELAEIIIENMHPLQSRYRPLTAEAGYIDSVLAERASRVRPFAEKTLPWLETKSG
jgi:hypothetical protein